MKNLIKVKNIIITINFIVVITFAILVITENFKGIFIPIFSVLLAVLAIATFVLSIYIALITKKNKK
mgnify:CR=1 FL=1